MDVPQYFANSNTSKMHKNPPSNRAKLERTPLLEALSRTFEVICSVLFYVDRKTAINSKGPRLRRNRQTRRGPFRTSIEPCDVGTSRRRSPVYRVNIKFPDGKLVRPQKTPSVPVVVGKTFSTRTFRPCLAENFRASPREIGNRCTAPAAAIAIKLFRSGNKNL